MEILLIRHGESELNPLPIVQGRSDHVSLSEEGRRQARILRDALLDMEFDEIHCSVSKRARETAELALPEQEKIYSEEIVEISRGEWEGKTFEELGDPKPPKDITEEEMLSFKAPGGESYSELIERVTEWFEKIDDSGGRLAVFSHGQTIRALLIGVLGIAPLEARRIEIGNTSITRIRKSDEGWELVEVNNAEHLDLA